jgi:hypothetical protein
MTPSDSEDPLELFPSENPRTTAVRPPRALQTAARWLVLLATASRSVLRFVVILCARAVASLRTYRVPRIQVNRLRVPRMHLPDWRAPAWRLPAMHLPAWRLPAWRLPKWRLPAWRLPAWHLPKWRVPAWQPRDVPVWHPPEPRISEWRAPEPARSEPRTSQWHEFALRSRVLTDVLDAFAAALRVSRRAPVATIAISAFAGGIVVGGSAVWLSGASRHVGAQPAGSQPAAVVSQTQLSAATPAHTRSFTDVELPAAASRTPPAASAVSRRPQFRGSLIVNSRPSGAKVFLNGRSVGTTPLVLRNQIAGSRAVRVAMDGYESWSSAVQVNADTETRLRAELKAQRPSAQP